MESEWNYLIHLSEIIFDDKVIHVYWHQILRSVILGHGSQLYTFTMPGTKSYDLTMRQLLQGLGVEPSVPLDIRLDASKAHDFTAEEILNGDCWNTVKHQIRVCKSS